MAKQHGNSKYTTAKGKSICNLLAEGVSMKAACKKLKLNYSTAYNWKQDNKEFKELSKRAREAGIDAIGDDCLEICDRTDLDPQDKRIRIDTRLRLLGKWNPKKWGDKTQLTGADGEGPAVIEAIQRTIIQPKNPK